MKYRGWTIEENEYEWYEAYHPESESHLFALTLDCVMIEIDKLLDA